MVRLSFPFITNHTLKQEDFELEAKDAAKAMLKKMESPKTHDVKDDPLGEYFEGIR